MYSKWVQGRHKNAPKRLAQAGDSQDSLNISLQKKDAEVKGIKWFAFTRHCPVLNAEVMLVRQFQN